VRALESAMTRSLVFSATLPASLAGGAGARPDHPVSGHERAAFAAMHGRDLLLSHLKTYRCLERVSRRRSFP
jgi:hypothetical protein